MLTNKKLLSIKKGAEAKRQQRLDLLEKIKQETKCDINNLKDKNLWLSGIMLYWGEGSKEKPHNISQQVIFSNSDPRMIRVFLKWLKEIINIPKEDIGFEVYIHETGDVESALNWWSKITACDKGKLKVYFKKHSLKTNRKNINKDYYGLLRIKVRRSSNLNRRIAGWINAICEHWGVVQW